MNIGDVSKISGLPAKTIRYYEGIGLVRPQRLSNGYRKFEDSDLHKLRFLGRARSLGFTIEDCRALLALYEDDQRESIEVKRLAQRHITKIDEKLRQLQSMHATLSDLIEACAGDHRPDCPIIDDLAR